MAEIKLKKHKISLHRPVIHFRSHAPKTAAELKRHHVAIVAGTVLVTLTILTMLFGVTKNRRVQAGSNTTFEIVTPTIATAADSDIALPELHALSSASALALPSSELISEPAVSITSRDGIPVSGDLSADAGLFKRGSVQMTRELARFSQNLSSFFARNQMSALITSAVRTSTGQLDIIKQRISEYGMLRAFPALAHATIRDTSAWAPAVEWLKSHHVPVNPPADYKNEDGSAVSGSLHLKGLALDVVADNLDALSRAIEKYANSSANYSSPLRISAIVRERSCVHLSLTK